MMNSSHYFLKVDGSNSFDCPFGLSLAYDIQATMHMKSHTRYNQLINWSATPDLVLNERIMEYNSGSDHLNEYDSDGSDYTVIAMKKYIKRGFTFLNAPKWYLDAYKKTLADGYSCERPVIRDFLGYYLGNRRVVGDHQDDLRYRRFKNFSFRTVLVLSKD